MGGSSRRGRVQVARQDGAMRRLSPVVSGRLLAAPVLLSGSALAERGGRC